MARPRNARPDTLEGELGIVVERLRLEKGWRAQELADGSGLAQSTIGRVERGEGSPSLEVVAAIARALGLTPAALMKHVKQWARK